MTPARAPARPSSAARSPSHGGYSVAELLVALALTSLIILIAGQLLVASIRVADRSRRELDPLSLVNVATELRADIHRSAAALAALDEGWQTGALELVGWDGTRVRYLLDGDRLVRETLGVVGQPSSRRSVAAGVASWWWRPVSPGTLEIRLSVEPVGATAAGRQTLARRFAIRGWPDGRSW